jgi:hypothetical protein
MLIILIYKKKTHDQKNEKRDQEEKVNGEDRIKD